MPKPTKKLTLLERVERAWANDKDEEVAWDILTEELPDDLRQQWSDRNDQIEQDARDKDSPHHVEFAAIKRCDIRFAKAAMKRLNE